MIKINQFPYAADTAFAIRDDDTSYFTAPQKLEEIYKMAWNLGFKVSLAVIPMHKGTNNLNVPPEYRQTGNYYKINENTELVNYIRAKLGKRDIDILLHGFCHSENTNLPRIFFNFQKGCLEFENKFKIDLANYSEFFLDDPATINYKIQLGKAILEKTFGKNVGVFVSPQEFLTKQLWKCLVHNNLNYCGTIGRNFSRQAPISHLNYYYILKAILRRSLNYRSDLINEDMTKATKFLSISSTYRHYWNKFLDIDTSENWFNWFKWDFANRMNHRTYSILLSHYWEYFYDWNESVTQKLQIKYLHNLLNYVNSFPNIWKCSINELVGWLIARDNISIKEGSNEIKIKSSYDVDGLSLLCSSNIRLSQLDSEKFSIKETDYGKFIIFNIKKDEIIYIPIY